MKHKQYLTKTDYEKFDYSDTRYYGVFYRGKKRETTVWIDIRRFRQFVGEKLSNDQLRIINARQTHYFRPAKNEYFDYHCNRFEAETKELKEYWTQHFSPLITYAKDSLKKPEALTIGDCDLMMCGILDPDEANIWANHENMRNEWRYLQERAMVVGNLYAQFIHHMASSIECATVAVLTEEKAIGDHFDRNTLYGTAVNTGKSVKDLPSFSWYDKLYSLWNFIKHNSRSTYDKIKDCYPDALIKGLDYKQGDLAAALVNFSDEMIVSLIDGVSSFFKEYCELVFHEKFEEAQWNYNRYFLNLVYDSIDVITNPLGIPNYL